MVDTCEFWTQDVKLQNSFFNMDSVKVKNTFVEMPIDMETNFMLVPDTPMSSPGKIQSPYFMRSPSHKLGPDCSIEYDDMDVLTTDDSGALTPDTEVTDTSMHLASTHSLSEGNEDSPKLSPHNSPKLSPISCEYDEDTLPPPVSTPSPSHCGWNPYVASFQPADMMSLMDVRTYYPGYPEEMYAAVRSSRQQLQFTETNGRSGAWNFTAPKTQSELQIGRCVVLRDLSGKGASLNGFWGKIGGIGIELKPSGSTRFAVVLDDFVPPMTFCVKASKLLLATRCNRF